jgi:F-type H+-transporting ATPase subunit gamma
VDVNLENLTFGHVQRLANDFMHQFTSVQIDALHVCYMNFISTGVQRAEVLQLLPLAGLAQTLDLIGRQTAEGEAQAARGALDARRGGPEATVTPAHGAPGVLVAETIYDFSPGAAELLSDILPLTVRTALYQCFLDAITSENVARMVAMKSATDNADKMVKSLTMEYNRARQSQITTELSEIMGGVEAMKG